MLAVSILILSIGIGISFLVIHDEDEIHQIVAFLSGLIALICIFVLIPPLIKGLLGLLLITIVPKIFPVHNSFR